MAEWRREGDLEVRAVRPEIVAVIAVTVVEVVVADALAAVANERRINLQSRQQRGLILQERES